MSGIPQESGAQGFVKVDGQWYFWQHDKFAVAPGGRARKITQGYQDLHCEECAAEVEKAVADIFQNIRPPQVGERVQLYADFAGVWVNNTEVPQHQSAQIRNPLERIADACDRAFNRLGCGHARKAPENPVATSVDETNQLLKRTPSFLSSPYAIPVHSHGVVIDTPSISPQTRQDLDTAQHKLSDIESKIDTLLEQKEQLIRQGATLNQNQQEIFNLRNQISSDKQTIADLRSELSNKEDEVSELEDQVEKLKPRIETAELKVQKLTKERAALEKDHAGKIEELNAQIQELSGDNQAAKTEINRLKESKAQLEAGHDQTVRALNERINIADQQVLDSKEELANLQKHLDASLAAHEETQKAVKEQGEKTQQEIAELRRLLQGNTEAQQQHQAVAKELEQVKQDLVTAQKALKKLEGEKQALETQKNQVIEGLQQKQVELQSALEAAKEQNTQVEAQVAAKKQELTAAQNQIDQLNSQIKDLKEELRLLKEDHSSLTFDNIKLEKDNENQDRRIQELTAKNTELEAQLKERNALVENIQAAITDFEQKIAELNKKNEELKQKIVKLVRETTELAEISQALAGGNIKLATKLNEMSEDNRKQAEEMIALKTALEGKDRDIANHEREVTRLNKEVESLKNEHQSAMDKMMKEREAEFAKYGESNAALIERSLAAEAECQKALQSLNDSNLIIQEKNRIISALEEQLKKVAQEQEGTGAQMSAQLAQLQKQLEEAKQANQEQKLVVNKLQEELDQAKQLSLELSIEVDQNQGLAQQVQQLKAAAKLAADGLNEINANNKREVDRLTKLLAIANERLGKKDSKIDKLMNFQSAAFQKNREENKKLRAGLKELTESNAALQKELAAQQAAHLVERQKLGQEIADLKAQLDTLRKEKTELETKNQGVSGIATQQQETITELESRLVNLQQLADQQGGGLAGLEVQLHELQKQKDTAAKQVLEFEAQLAEQITQAKKESADLKNQIDMLTAQNKELTEYQEELRFEQQATESLLVNITEQHEIALGTKQHLFDELVLKNKKIAQLNRQLADMSQGRQSSDETVTRLRTELATQSRAQEQLQKEAADSDLALRRAQAEIQLLTDANERLQHKFTEIGSEVETNRHELDSLKASHRDMLKGILRSLAPSHPFLSVEADSIDDYIIALENHIQTEINTVQVTLQGINDHNDLLALGINVDDIIAKLTLKDKSFKADSASGKAKVTAAIVDRLIEIANTRPMPLNRLIEGLTLSLTNLRIIVNNWSDIENEESGKLVGVLKGFYLATDKKEKVDDKSFNKPLENLRLAANSPSGTITVDGKATSVHDITHTILSDLYDQYNREMRKANGFNETFAKKMVYILREIVKIKFKVEPMISQSDRKIINEHFKGYIDKLNDYLSAG